jgi:hypothetical protein
MPIVYQHIRKDSRKVFYIGIGKTIKRAFSIRNRNAYWHNIVNRYGYEVEILISNISWELACENEILLIKTYGRCNTNSGPLVNMTDGGEGLNGYITSSKTKNLLHDINIGSKNPMWNKKIKDNPHWKIFPPNKKSVNQYSLDGCFIKQHKSIIEAQMDTKVAKSSISKCCKGSLKRAGKFIWKYSI